MKQLLLDIKPTAPPTLHNFVIGRNAEALASLEAVFSYSSQPSFIYLWGEAGSGKSHLLQACKALNAHIADDVHLLNAEAQIDLFNTYNQLKEAGGILITAGLHAPNQMGLRDDLATRLAWGLVYQLQPLNDAEKALA
ncbi:MAG: DnaA/Hda family protein, partial [Methylotenera sp.]